MVKWRSSGRGCPLQKLKCEIPGENGGGGGGGGASDHIELTYMMSEFYYNFYTCPYPKSKLNKK